MDDIEKFFEELSKDFDGVIPDYRIEKLLAIAKAAVEQLEYLSQVYDCLSCNVKDISQGTLTKINDLIKEK